MAAPRPRAYVGGMLPRARPNVTYPIAVAIETSRGRGETRSIGPTRVTFVTSAAFESGDSLRFAMTLPGDSGETLDIFCSGAVCGVSMEGALFVVEAAIDESRITIAPAQGFDGPPCSTTVPLPQQEICPMNEHANPPWFPSLMAFEHYDSGRSHLFPEAVFGGSMDGANRVTTRSSASSYPTPYNVVYLGPGEIYLYGGGYGDVEGGTGAFVAKVDPVSLEPVWMTKLIDTIETNEWDYPGVLSALRDGYLYQIYGYRLARIDAADGTVIKTLVLPTLAQPRDTSYNGLDALPDGTLIAKTVYREEGCEEQGFSAFLDCTDPSNVPSSLVVAIDPGELRVITCIEAPEFIGGRLTISRFEGKDYVYLAGTTTVFRYIYEDGRFTPDDSWNPGLIYKEGQTSGTAVVVLNDWVVLQTNAAPADTPLSVIAISQKDASRQFSTQPFAEFRSPRLYPTSISPSAVSVDPAHQRIYALDAGPGRIGAVELSDHGLHTVWTEAQRTTEFLALIGPEDRRVIVGTELPHGQPLGGTSHDFVVWRDAATGRELARTREPLTAISTGSMVEPYYFARMYYLAKTGEVIELTVQPEGA